MAARKLRQELQQPHGIDIENRRRLPVITGDRIIPRKRQHVAKAFAGQLPAAAFQRIAIPVLARKMDDDFLPAMHQVAADGIGAQHGVTAGIIGDAQRVEARVFRQRARQAQHSAAAGVRNQASRRHQFGDGDKP